MLRVFARLQCEQCFKGTAFLTPAGLPLGLVVTAIWFQTQLILTVRSATIVSCGIIAALNSSERRETAIREALRNLLPQMLLLVQTGLWRSTMMSLFVIPIVFAVPILAIPELVQRDGWNTLLIDPIILGYMFAILNQRRSFLLEYCFQDEK